MALKFTEIRTSNWLNINTGKSCKIISTKLDNGDWRFAFSHWNPFPCKVMEGSFSVLAEWLLANGWVHDKSKADMVFIECTQQ